ncbi:YceI family protein [Salinicola corii]|uniref:YceI family protein n=1 Tax=Salinicola corii TaxID=2606937 RepID=A0A640WJA5_9GAMM|nr:YceI family protein [Salinicola corii]KAA0020708.1 YceI family protein [Salinicola corii]
MRSAQLNILPALVLLALASSPANAEPQRFDIDHEHFSIAFMVDHLGYANLLGQFLEGEGAFVYDRETQTLVSAEVTIQSSSVFTNLGARDEHLRGRDFLDADNHPRIHFVATDFKPSSPTTGSLNGKLTLLGRTEPVTLDVTLNQDAVYPFGPGQPTLGLSVRGALDRSNWGMNYGVDDGMVGDHVTLIFELEAV